MLHGSCSEAYINGGRDEITGEQIREIVDAVEKMGEEIAQDLR